MINLLSLLNKDFKVDEGQNKFNKRIKITRRGCSPKKRVYQIDCLSISNWLQVYRIRLKYSAFLLVHNLGLIKRTEIDS